MRVAALNNESVTKSTDLSIPNEETTDTLVSDLPLTQCIRCGRFVLKGVATSSCRVDSRGHNVSRPLSTHRQPDQNIDRERSIELDGEVTSCYIEYLLWSCSNGSIGSLCQRSILVISPCAHSKLKPTKSSVAPLPSLSAIFLVPVDGVQQLYVGTAA